MFRKSIRNKLIFLLLIITILPFATSIAYSYYYTNEAVKDLFIQENIHLLSQGKLNLENYIEDLNGLTLSLYNNQQIYNSLRKETDESELGTYQELKDQFYSILYGDQHVKQVSFYSENRKQEYSLSRNSTVLVSDKHSLEESFEIKQAKTAPYYFHLQSTHPLQYKGLHFNSISSNEKVISLYRSIINVPTREFLGVIRIDVGLHHINDMIGDLYNKGSDHFYLLDPEGNVTYTSDAMKYNRQLFQEIQQRKETHGVIEWKDSSFDGIMIYQRLPATVGALTLIKGIEFDVLYQDSRRIAKMNIIMGMVMLIVMVIATFIVSIRITSPIRVLLRNMREIEKGHMEVNFDSLGEDEIGVLGKRFKEMIHAIKSYIDREYRMEVENKRNQLKVLKSQINPHFLNNALQSIGTLALLQGAPQVYKLLTSLSSMMRYSINMNDDFVPLSEEINHVNDYLSLQKQRFGERLITSMDLDDETMNVKVPKMIIQPIIENYFKHGFEDGKKQGFIEIRSKMKEYTKLEITIEDNGKGVTSEDLHMIREIICDVKGIEGTSGNIGLKNVFKRLQLYLGEAADIFIDQSVQGGLKVSITVPVVEKGEGIS